MATMPARKRKQRAEWGAEDIRALRKHLGFTQKEMSHELGTRQQTISEWETGMYRPRGASSRLLTIIAERAGFEYMAKAGHRRRRRGGGQHSSDSGRKG